MGGRGGGIVAPILTGVGVGAAVFTGGASLAVAAGIGAATAGVAAASGAGSISKAPGLPPVADIPPVIGSPADQAAISSAQDIVKKRRSGAVGVLEKRGGKSGSAFSGLLKQTETRGGLLIG